MSSANRKTFGPTTASGVANKHKVIEFHLGKRGHKVHGTLRKKKPFCGPSYFNTGD